MLNIDPRLVALCGNSLARVIALSAPLEAARRIQEETRVGILNLHLSAKAKLADYDEEAAAIYFDTIAARMEETAKEMRENAARAKNAQVIHILPWKNETEPKGGHAA